MRLISSYRTLYTIIVMGSYSRSFLIASVVSLIGIGICLALEHRWRNLGQAPSDRRLAQSDQVLVKTRTTEETEDNPQPSSESMPFDDDSPEQKGSSEEVLKVDHIKGNEDDVTVLFGPLSNLSIHVKSSPGLPEMDIDHKDIINNQDDKQQSQIEDTFEDIKSCESCSKLLSDVEIGDNSSWIKKIMEYVKLDISRDNSNEEARPNQETQEAIGNQIVALTVITDNVTIVDEKQEYLLQNDDNAHLINQGTIVNEKQECPLQNVDSLHLIKDYQEPKVDEKLENNAVEYSCLTHNLEQCTSEPTEDKSVTPSFNPYPTECFVLNVGTEDLTIPEIFMAKTVQNAEPTSPLAVDHQTDIQPGSKSSSLQEMKMLVESKDNSVSSGIGDFQRSPLEETRSARSVRESLEETYASISSVAQSPRKLEKDSTVPTVNKENAKYESKSHQNRPIRNGLRYSDMVAIPKKAKLNYEESSGDSKEKKDDIPKNPKRIDKNRVRRLVGFFENKCDKH